MRRDDDFSNVILNSTSATPSEISPIRNDVMIPPIHIMDGDEPVKLTLGIVEGVA